MIRRRTSWAGRPLRQRVFWVRAGLWTAVLFGAGFAGFLALERIQVPLALARAPAQGAPAAAGAKPVREKVRITFATLPPAVKAEVRWGKKKLGVINAGKKPFYIERPKDSGPMDLTIRAEGFLTLHTRAYTFETHKLTVKLTPVTEKHTIFGFKQTPDGGVDGGAGDAGAPPAPPAPVPLGPPLPPPGQ